jgi:1-acyl-sn-glycerol-3-phosphate acyltransferase
LFSTEYNVNTELGKKKTIKPIAKIITAAIGSMIDLLRFINRLFLFMMMVLSYFVWMNGLMLAKIVVKAKVRPITQTSVRFFCSLMLKILNIKVEFVFESKENIILQGNYLIVSNHLSYLDIIILAAYFNTCFVSSTETRQTVFLGEISYLAGCIFIERRHHRQLIKDLKQIEELLKQGSNVAVFPEATSSNGTAVLPFYPLFYKAAVNSATPILTICLNYQSINGQAITMENKDQLLWYGDMTFLPHFLNLLKTNTITVKMTAVDLIPSINRNTRELSAQTRDIIQMHFKPIG